MRNIVIEELKQLPMDEQKIEIVERKGLGHPDYICDSIMNQISINLSKYYIKNFGSILHHNIDKALLAAGEVENKFGGGKIKKPMLLVIGDRATYFTEEKEVPVSEISISTAKEWFKKNLRFVDPEEHVKYQIELKQVSSALKSIFEKKRKILGANDTSATVGYAPLSNTEKIVFETERYINSKEFKKEFPETGEDVKVMGIRKNKTLDLTIALAFIDRFIDCEETYFRRKKEVEDKLKEYLNSNYNFEKINININTLDKKGKGEAGIFLTVSGTCADGADSGQVGRGNRVNGVIPLKRPTSSEAAAGKNPVSHVGKIYNVLAYKLAEEIYEKVPGLKEVYIWLVSKIGMSIDQPAMVATQVILEDKTLIENVRKEIEEIINKRLDNIDKFCMDLAKGKYSVC
ncbi:MAG: methionine adenosyltransferase [Candidatus Aenigmarchaeota archaeon]|nr:methionine adenosyltransferase [Candidatus Aenigmarchaeota archaeon]